MNDQLPNLVTIYFDKKESKYKFLNSLSNYLLDEKDNVKKKYDNRKFIIGEKVLFGLFKSDSITISKEEYEYLPHAFTVLINTSSLDFHKSLFKNPTNHYTSHLELFY